MTIKNNFEISLDKFIDFALYDKKKGYYMQKNPFGLKGDFITAPNISRMFSEMIAVWILGFWENLGTPKKINLVELGAGNGEMMKIFLETFKKFPAFLSSCNILVRSIRSVDRIEPWAISPSIVMATHNPAYKSFSREAIIPITPLCQPLPFTIV